MKARDLAQLIIKMSQDVSIRTSHLEYTATNIYTIDLVEEKLNSLKILKHLYNADMPISREKYWGKVFTHLMNHYKQ